MFPKYTATILFFIIVLIDFNSDILKIKHYKKNKMNKIVLFLIILLLLIFIEYLEDYVTYNYLDDSLKKDSLIKGIDQDICMENSYYDAIFAGTIEELLFRLLIFNVILIRTFKIDHNKSILISSLLFGIIHINQYISFGVNIYNTIAVIIQAIPAGALFAYLYANTNLSTVIFIHFLMDMIDFGLLRCNKSLYRKILFIN